MRTSLDRESIDDVRDRRHDHRSGRAAVKPKIQRDLVVARPARVQGGAGRCELRQPALDCRVDVFVGLLEIELTGVELAFDPPEAALDRDQLRSGQQARRGQPARVRNAPGDVEWIELEVDLERRRELLELRQQRAAEPAAPQLLAPSPARGRVGVGGGTSLACYGVSLFTSPSKLPRSRACTWPWTRAAVRTPIPHSLMKPAAADWSNASPFP